MNLKLTAALAATALAASLAFTSFVPVASAQAVPPIIGPAMHVIQALEQKVAALSSTVAGFADSFTTKELTFTSGTGNQLTVQTLCIGQTCINEAQLQALLAGQSAAAVQTNAAVSAANTTDATTAIDESPIIEINGDNPAIVQVGANYQDLGATIEGPQQDLNLGITTYLNGTLTSNIVIDTTQAATDTIDYVATNQSGLTSTSTRTVIIEAPSSPAASNSTATTTDATTTAQ